MTYDFLETLYDDTMIILNKLVIKRQDLAQQNETVDSIKAFDLYYACLNGSRYFYNFDGFDIDILEKYLSPQEVIDCYKDPDLIPQAYRKQIVDDQAKRVIETYEEQNEYYRMLNGLPPKNDHYWIYITDDPRIPKDVPIHELEIEQIAYLDTRGILDKLIEENPSKTYLQYLGIDKIDLIDARLARPFDILRSGIPRNSMVTDMFQKEYYGARRYIMATVYNRDMFTNKTLYDPFIGLLMITLAVRNTLVPDEAAYLNFEEILDAILESYGLKRYFENFPFTFKRRLVLALDNILKVKGTDGVLVDICRIFSMENFDAKRYFLMKTQPKDKDGNIIFTGDVEQDNDLHFVKAPIEDHEISYRQDDITPYETVVNNDYLWQLTEDELHELLTEDFNIMMSKYIDIEATYDLTALTFEVCYFLNLLLHSRKNMLRIYCTNMYAGAGKSEAYTMIVFLLAALAKRSGFDGNIVYEQDHIEEILRFNNSNIMDEIRSIVKSYEGNIDVDESLIPGYDSPPALQFPLGLVKEQQMIETYVYNRALYDAICKEMNTTNDIRRYIALSNAKKCMYTSWMEHEDFTKLDGTPAHTYYEMLDDLDPYLAAKLDSIDMKEKANDLDKLIIYILEKLEDLFNSEELHYLFLNTPSTYGALIEKYLRMAINVFKASSVQLDSINVFFRVGDHDPIRVIEQNIRHIKLGIDDTVYIDEEIATHKTIGVDDTVYGLDKAYYNT